MPAKIVAKRRREAVDIAFVRNKDVLILETVPGYDYEVGAYRDPDHVKAETDAAVERWKRGLGL